MPFILLDAGGAGLAFAVLIVYMIVAVVVEALAMLIMKYNNVGKVFLDSFVANIASLVSGYLLYAVTGTVFDITGSVFFNWMLLLILSIAVEFAILYFMNRARPVKRTLIVAIIMNIATYIILYLYVEGI